MYPMRPPGSFSVFGSFSVSPQEAVQRLNVILAHAWMVRTFLKHADEIQEDEELLDVPRTIFDYTRAVEPAFQRGDTKDYLHRIRGKLPRLRRVAELFAREHRRVSDHTNFQMAALSLTGCVRQIEEVLAAVKREGGEGTSQSAESDQESGPGSLEV
jgi:hypothetical protein